MLDNTADVLEPVIGGISDKHAAARECAKAGIRCFPCVENGKPPATENGFYDATDNLEQIDAWWTENPNYNIAICPEDAGLCVIDIDPGGEAGWIEAITDGGGHEPTYEVITPRGGRHLYFRGSLPSTANKIAPHVDTRGVGGYVLVPPSVVNGKSYRVMYDRDPRPFRNGSALELRRALADLRVMMRRRTLLPPSPERPITFADW